jgi:hypothetical protein
MVVDPGQQQARQRDVDFLGRTEIPLDRHFDDGPNPAGEQRALLHYGSSIKEGKMINELDCIVLTTDLSEYGLAAGDIGTVVMVHPNGQWRVTG